MKNYLFILFAVLFIAATSCKSGKTPNVNDELTDEQKAAITAEIQKLFDFSSDGITELDAEKAFSVFSKEEGVKYVRNGYLYQSIETAKNQYAEWFASPEAVKRKIIADPIIYDILDKNTVLVTAIGSAVEIDADSTDQSPWVLAYTILYRKEESGWKLFHMHNLWE